MMNQWDPLPEPSVRTLANGLRVVVVPRAHLHLAAVAVFVRVGSRFEAADTNGLSHLLEHVLFRGCAAYPDTFALNNAIEACASGLDAATARDFTSFEATTLPAQLPRILALIADMLTEPTFQDIGLERQIIAEELQDEVDDKGVDIDAENLAKRALFQGSSLALKIGGSIRDLDKFGAAELADWFARHYVAGNMVVAISGRVDPEQAIEDVRATLGRLPAGAPCTPGAPQIREDLPAVEIVTHSANQTTLQWSWAVPGAAHEDWPALWVLQRLLDDGSSAQLRHRLVDRHGLAYHAGADLEGYEGLSVMSLYTETRHEQVVRAVDEVHALMTERRTEAPTQAQLDRVVGRIELDLIGLQDDASGMAYWCGLQALRGAPLVPEARLARVRRLTADDLRRVSDRWLGLERAQLTVVGKLPVLARAHLRRRVHWARRHLASGGSRDEMAI